MAIMGGGLVMGMLPETPGETAPPISESFLSHQGGQTDLSQSDDPFEHQAPLIVSPDRVDGLESPIQREPGAGSQTARLPELSGTQASRNEILPAVLDDLLGSSLHEPSAQNANNADRFVPLTPATGSEAAIPPESANQNSSGNGSSQSAAGGLGGNTHPGTNSTNVGQTGEISADTLNGAAGPAVPNRGAASSHGEIQPLKVKGPNKLVQIEANDPSANEDGDPGEFTVRRTRPGGSLTVGYEVTGTATEGADYESLSGQVTLKPGQRHAKVKIDPIDDSIPDSGETVVLTLDHVSDSKYQIDGDNQSDTVTIFNDESGGSGGSGGGSGGTGYEPGDHDYCELLTQNTDPLAVDEIVDTVEDNPVTVSVLANDSDLDDGQSIFVTDVTSGTNGTVTFTADKVAYTPDENWSGSDQFDYTIKDGHGGEAMATVYVNIDPADDIPVARTDIEVVGEGASLGIDLVGNDSDVEGPVTVDWVDSTSSFGAPVTDNGDGTATYDNYMQGSGGSGGGGSSWGSGWDDFSYGIIDSTANPATGHVDIYVISDYPGFDAPPFSRPDSATTMEDTTLNDIDVLANDWDDNSGLTITSAYSNDPNAIVTHDGSTIDYTPPDNFHGTATVHYEIEDSIGQTGSYSSGGTIEIDVEAVNDEPVANDDPEPPETAIPVWAGASVVIQNLNNDTDVEVAQGTQSLIVTNVTQGTKGKVIFDDSSVTYVPNPNESGTDSFTYTVKDGHGGSDTATVDVEIKKIDLDVKKIDHNSPNGDLDECKEEDHGAFVPLNNDDDNYDDLIDNELNPFDPDPEANADPVAGENDLLPIVLNKIAPVAEGGNYTLTYPENDIRIWKKNDRTGDVDSGVTTFDATDDTTLYVEGTKVGSVVIKVNWTDGTDTVNNADRIKVTSFNWNGPLNVPGHAKYTYKGSGAAGDGLSRWLNPNPAGASAERFLHSDTAPDEVDILWNAGPSNGKAVYQAHPDYIWDLDVNVVQVTIAAPDMGQAFDKGTPGDNGTGLTNFAGPGQFNQVLAKRVKASDTFPNKAGLKWTAKVTLEGPSRSGVDGRGVKFINVGFIQILVDYANQGTYNTADITLVSSMVEGAPYLDQSSPVPAGPWYAGNDGAKLFSEDPMGAASVTKTISSEDTPFQTVPLTADQGDTVEQGDDIIDDWELRLTFELNIAAQTTDSREGADEIFTQMAIVDWTFDGSDEQIGQVAPYAWDGKDATGQLIAEITAPAAWTPPVTAGSRVVIPTGLTANQAAFDMTFN